MGTNQPLPELLRRINQVLRGWTTYFRHGVSSRTFAHVHQFTWKRIVHSLRPKHPRAPWKWLKRRYLANNWWPEHDGVSLLNCGTVPITGIAIAAPRSRHPGLRPAPSPDQRHEPAESRMRWKSHVRFGRRPGETHQPKRRQGGRGRSHHANSKVGRVPTAGPGRDPRAPGPRGRPALPMPEAAVEGRGTPGRRWVYQTGKAGSVRLPPFRHYRIRSILYAGRPNWNLHTSLSIEIRTETTPLNMRHDISCIL